jgi:tetratricopeptide (TPR) repeat protein
VEGDNNFFPLIYGRIVERMREDVRLYDRLGIVFEFPGLEGAEKYEVPGWQEVRGKLEREIIEETYPVGVFYAVFNPHSISTSDQYALIPYCLLDKVVKKKQSMEPYRIGHLWSYYAAESFYDHFERDFMNRQISAHFYLRYGHFLFMARNGEQALDYIKKASRIAFDDPGVHSAAATILTNEGFLEEAREELEKSSLHGENPGVVHNNWGCLYHKKGDYDRAIEFFSKAIQSSPGNHTYYKNLGHALYSAGKNVEATRAFRRSLEIIKNQPDIDQFMKEHGL